MSRVNTRCPSRRFLWWTWVKHKWKCVGGTNYGMYDVIYYYKCENCKETATG